MADIIIIGILLLVIGGAVAYLVRAKKRGTACIGCPAGGQCAKRKHGHSECSCGCGDSLDK